MDLNTYDTLMAKLNAELAAPVPNYGNIQRLIGQSGCPHLQQMAQPYMQAAQQRSLALN